MFAVVGNKIDLEAERVVSLEQGQDLARASNAGFFETSAKARINIDEMFHEIGRRTMQHMKAIANVKGSGKKAKGGRNGNCVVQ
jgi:GTPase SAR1 family protein